MTSAGFNHAKQLFLEYLKAIKNASVHTIRNYGIDLSNFQEFLTAELKESSEVYLDDINRKTIRNFLAHLTHSKQHKRTIVRRLSTLRSFFKYTFEHQLSSTNPTETLDTPKIDKKIPSPLSYDQVKVLFDTPDIKSYLGFRDRTILELFYSSGLRISELAALNRQDVNFQDLLIKLKGKGKKERVVPITPNAASWISVYLDHPERHRDIDGHLAEKDHQAIFLNRLGTRLSSRSIDRQFEIYFKQSGLAGKATPHTLRHTIATHWLENGMDLKTIQLLLGHSTLATTTIYTGVSNTLKMKVYQESHPRAQNLDNSISVSISLKYE